MTFTQQVYHYVKKIPIGETRSYKEVAIAIGRPKSARAVANVLAKNYDLEIPCHRVIRSDGTMSGYNRGGSHKKLTLLKKEGALK